MLVKSAPTQQRDFERCRSSSTIRSSSLRHRYKEHSLGASYDVKGHAKTALERETARCNGVGNSKNPLSVADDLRDARCLLETVVADRLGRHEHIVGSEAGINRLQLQEGADKQSRLDYGDQSQRHLTYHQDGTELFPAKGQCWKRLLLSLRVAARLGRDAPMTGTRPKIIPARTETPTVKNSMFITVGSQPGNGNDSILDEAVHNSGVKSGTSTTQIPGTRLRERKRRF
jgi:hypothetical protein